MLGKVLKYDLKSMGKSLFPLYAGLVVLALVLKFIGFITDSVSSFSITAFSFIYNIMFIFFIILVVGGLFYTFFVSIMRYYKNLYSDEGYLTHTLPVNVGSLLLSKVIASLIFIVLSVIISFISIMLVLGFNDVFNILKDGLEFFSLCSGMNVGTIVIWAIFFLLLSYICYILMVYAGISLGNMHSKNKITFSIVYTAVIYYVTQMLGVILLVIIFLITPDIMNQLDQAIPDKEYFLRVIGFGMGLNIVLLFVCYFICYNRLKHLNLS